MLVQAMLGKCRMPNEPIIPVAITGVALGTYALTSYIGALGVANATGAVLPACISPPWALVPCCIIHNLERI